MDYVSCDMKYIIDIEIRINNDLLVTYKILKETKETSHMSQFHTTSVTLMTHKINSFFHTEGFSERGLWLAIIINNFFLNINFLI